MCSRSAPGQAGGGGGGGGVDWGVGVGVNGGRVCRVSTLATMMTVTGCGRGSSRLAANGCHSATGCASFCGRCGRFIYCGRMGRGAGRCTIVDRAGMSRGLGSGCSNRCQCRRFFHGYRR